MPTGDLLIESVSPEAEEASFNPVERATISWESAGILLEMEGERPCALGPGHSLLKTTVLFLLCVSIRNA
jgi:hypothetical protein